MRTGMARFRRPCISWTTIEAVLPEAAGEVTHFEPYFFQTNDLGEETGFFVVKGPMDAIFKIMEEDEYRALVDKAYLPGRALQGRPADGGRRHHGTAGALGEGPDR